MKGLGAARLAITGALAFVAASFNTRAERHFQQNAVLKSGGVLPNDPTTGQFNYRGGAGTARVKRAAAKRRNVVRNRQAHRGKARR